MSPSLSFSSADPIREAAVALHDDHNSFDPLLDWMGEALIVLLGAGSYGTHEFLQARIAVTRRLIEERGFTAVALDADWLAVRSLNRFVRGRGRSTLASEALAGMGHFPSWRWQNAEMIGFANWLRAHNESLPPELQVGVYGINLFGIDSARQMALELFDRVAPDAAARLRERAALPPGGEIYLPLGLSTPLKEELIAQLLRMHHTQTEALMQQSAVDEDDYFFLMENARQSRSAEDYYRSLFVDVSPIWRVRAHYGAALVDALLEHQERRGPAKVVIWAHNVVVGDVRAVEVPHDSPPSLGQLMRERHAAETYIIGQTTDHGRVAAAAGWDRQMEHVRIPNAPTGSVEALLHQCGLPQFMLNLHGDEEAVDLLSDPLLERVAGPVLYPDRPIPTVSARLCDQFDTLLHFDATEPIRSQRGLGRRF